MEQKLLDTLDTAYTSRAKNDTAAFHCKITNQIILGRTHLSFSTCDMVLLVIWFYWNYFQIISRIFIQFIQLGLFRLVVTTFSCF